MQPIGGDAWVGVFYGGDYRSKSPPPRRLIGWPDDLAIEGHEQNVLWVGGYVWGGFDHFAVDLETGTPLRR